MSLAAISANSVDTGIDHADTEVIALGTAWRFN